MKFKTLKANNIYTIPIGQYFEKDETCCYMIYSPLANLFFLALPKEVESLEQLLKEGKRNNILEQLLKQSPSAEILPGDSYDTLCTLHLLLNEKCNFHCKYCYSAQGRSSAEVSSEQIRVALEYFLSTERTAVKDRTIMFAGGGEPVLSWDKIKESTFLAKEIAEKNGIKIHFSLTTNGSILNDEIIDFLKAHHFTVQISFEVLPDIQNEQRGMNDVVAHNLKKITEANIPNYVRSTITAANVDRIPEMVEYCQKIFPAVKKLSCQQVVDPDYFTSIEIVHDFFNRYLVSFNKATVIAQKTDMQLRSSSSHLINYSRREKFCYNLFCLTPYGTLTTCPDVSSPKEKDYQQSIFAEIKNDKIVFDDLAYKRLTSGNIHTIEKCQTCWARWNCGSGCPSSRRVYSPEIFDSICDFYRSILCHSLMTELSAKYKKATNKDFYKEIKAKLEE